MNGETLMKIKLIGLVAILTVALSACSSDNDKKGVDPTIRIIHASADAPTVNVLANGSVLNNLNNVDYQQASNRFTVGADTYLVEIEANLPGSTAVVLDENVSFDRNRNYDVFAVGSVADSSLALFAVDTEQMEPGSGNFLVNVVHAASAAPTVDIYVTAPNTDIETEQASLTASFTDASGLLELPAGDYQIRITPTGTKDVVFDSGMLSLSQGEEYLVAATNNVGTGASPVTLLAMTDTSVAKVWDVNTGADLRVVHAISDAPAVDVLLADGNVLKDALAFPNARGYLNVAAQSYTLDVVADADNSVVAIDDATVMLMTGSSYTAIANNTLSSADLDILVDNPRSVATEAKVRIVHASPAAGNVDIYVTTDGVIDGNTPNFANVPFSADAIAETGYVSLTPGQYFVTVTVAGTSNAAIETGALTLEAGGVYYAIARDPSADESGPGLILLDDFVSMN